MRNLLRPADTLLQCSRWVAACLLMLLLAPVAGGVDLDAFLKRDSFGAIKISPTGEYYAATVPLEDRTVLVVIRRADGQATARLGGNADTVIDDFHWANPTRVVASMAEKLGSEDRPFPNGQLYAVNVDGSRGVLLTAPASRVGVEAIGGHRNAAVYLLDLLPGDSRHVLVSVVEYAAAPQTSVEKLDIYTGQRSVVAAAPLRRARFVADRDGAVRFAIGAGDDNVSKLYYRSGREESWRLINDEAHSGIVERPLGLAADGSFAYLLAERDNGPDAVIAWYPDDGRRVELLRDPLVSPYAILRDPVSGEPAGAYFMHDGMRSRLFDQDSALAVRQRQLEAAFPGHAVAVGSATEDGRLLLVEVSSERNPGDFYLFDTEARHAEHVFSRRQWVDPALLPATRLISVQARDGLTLHGYLTEPQATPAPWPLVVLPHGGPFGVFDRWHFDEQSVLLAEAGYAVLRVNFRGSGNYGRRFEQAGARQWAGAMQRDLTDATRWAIDQGIAAADRICLVGASYGAYAALFGVASEPALYRCAVGYVGVYDLRQMYDDDAGISRSRKQWLDDWLGPRDSLDALSPVGMAARIQAPVLLIAGGRDRRAPIKHSQRMERALRKAGTPVETLYIATEGHGFYALAHRRQYYEQLLAFLARSLGGER
jgi:dipeptidyl aminopeptidase/acylaminoacyl peptidase